MAGLSKRVKVTTWVLMKIKPQRESSTGIRATDAPFCADRWVVKAEASAVARYPDCHVQSTRRHSCYRRRPQDLRGGNPSCKRKIFVDQFDQVTECYARQTTRAADLARAIGYAVGGRRVERRYPSPASSRVVS